MGFCCESKSLRMIAYGERPDQPSVHAEADLERILTTAMCTHPSCTHRLKALLLYQPAQSVESTSCLKGSNPLLMFAFEEELYVGLRSSICRTTLNVSTMWPRFRCHIRTASWATFGLRQRCDLVQRATCDHWGIVNVGPYTFVSRLYRRARQWRTGRYVRHCIEVAVVVSSLREKVT